MMSQRPMSSVECRVTARAARAFTLIELLTVLAIIGILAALIAPVLRHFSKSDVVEAATRQMLDDCARARQLAISQHSTVYMVFIPTNFWNDAMRQPPSPGNWLSIPLAMRTSSTVTQMYAAQWTGYILESLRGVGDQPGRDNPRDLQKLKTLPDGSFIAPIKFSWPSYLPPPNTPAPFVIQSNFAMYGFLRTNNIPFPSADVLTNAAYVFTFQANGGITLPYIAFNYLGQLTPGDSSVLPYDEYIPLAFGTTLTPKDPNTKSPVQGLPVVTEVPPGNSTNISYNLIHIDRITGRARVERQDVQ